MTETSPLASVAHPPARRRGRGALGLPLDGGAAACRSCRRGSIDRRRRRGRRGTASRPASCRCAGRGSRGTYYEDPDAAEKFDDGWLRTGDVASIDDARLHPHLRPLQGRHQVRRRVDLLGRPRERADGPRRDRRGGGDRQARRALVRAPARLRRARGRARRRRPPSSRSTSPRAWRSGGSRTTSPSSTRCRRRASASSTRRSCASASRRATSRPSANPYRRPDRHEPREPDDLPVRHAHAAVGRPAGDQPGLVGAVDADHAAAGPAGQHVRVGARPERPRPERAAEAAQALADPEAAGRRRGAGRAASR